MRHQYQLSLFQQYLSSLVLELQEEIPFHIDQVIEVTQGPFSDFSGTVKEIYPEKGKVKVEVSLFGRPTSVELDYTQLKGF